MNNLLQKISQWYSDEQEILNDLAHDVATSDTVEDMVTAKQAYSIQENKLNTIQEALRFVELEVEENEQN
ncbi:hypothetical protein [Psychrobacillus lasiicapitis]|uniref:Uncharacterized protein n=1 Tax=Psychrobacillus lasiicapitis TaxID=1636719 RepID=A0A544TA68_9BACI|nr:hypothetical protein [Psychrobacillus lasiicapitis]TQR14362.1 hypothetical protein FG382_07855 [Psychrobacillus lasiicapitis]GGA32007.1 hypothetical protein GCM10011384_21970 [Psychrobacillus lasiicapitis]